MSVAQTTGRVPQRFRAAFLVKALLPIAATAAIWVIPPPDGIKPHGWAVLAIFVGTVLGLILQPLPLGAVALIGMTVAMITKQVEPDTALSGFGNATIWLIVAAFFISRGFIVTGLGRRIALLFVRQLGRTSLGLAYGMAFTDLILAPAMPSNTARGAGIVYPIVNSLSHLSGSEPNSPSRRRLGAYLSVSSMNANAVTSAMFATSMAANPVVQELAKKQGVNITWGGWIAATIVPGLLSLLLLPPLVARLYRPEVTRTPEAPEEAKRLLAESGPVSRGEWIMLGTFGLLLFLWSAGSQLWDISATTTAFVGICVLLATGVLKWKDLAEDTSAWTTLVWFAVLVMLAGQLQDLGVIGWFSSEVTGAVDGLGWVTAFILISLVYLYSHYAFASNTAHVAAMYAAFLTAAIAAGTPPELAAIVLGAISSLFGALTHYSSGPAPVFFGAGYATLGEWWRVNFLVTLPVVAVWMAAGGGWMKLIGLW